MCIRHSEKYYYRKEAGFQCFAGQEVKLRERNKIKSRPRSERAGREEGSTTAFTRLLPSRSKQRGFPKANPVNGAGHVFCNNKKLRSRGTLVLVRRA